MAAPPAAAAAAGAAPAGTTEGTRTVRDRTGGRAAVHGVQENVARAAGVLPNMKYENDACAQKGKGKS